MAVIYNSSFFQTPAAREGVCITFEKVVVQNILHGRSIPLCEAIQSISRWQFIKTAFPHVMHCSATMLQEKLQDVNASCIIEPHLSRQRPPLQFTPAETKLLYTLHWILLDAASECEDAELENINKREASKEGISQYRFLHDLNSLQLFIYLFAPFIEKLQANDFESLKLETGLSIWVPLMAFCQPQQGTLSLPVKLFDLDHISSMSALFTPILIDDLLVEDMGSSVDNTASKSVPLTNKSAVEHQSAIYLTRRREPSSKKVAGIYLGEDYPTETNDKDAKKISLKLEEHGSVMNASKTTIDLRIAQECIPPVEIDSEEIESVDVEKQRVGQVGPSSVNQRLPGGSQKNWQPSCQGLPRAPPKAVPESMDDDEINSANWKHPTIEDTLTQVEETSEHDNMASGFTRISRILQKATNEIKMENHARQVGTANYLLSPLATHCDVAAIRCLFCGELSEAGAYWVLRYLFNRLLWLRKLSLHRSEESRRLNKLTRESVSLRYLVRAFSEDCGPGAASQHQRGPTILSLISLAQRKVVSLAASLPELNLLHEESSMDMCDDMNYEGSRTGPLSQQDDTALPVKFAQDPSTSTDKVHHPFSNLHSQWTLGGRQIQALKIGHTPVSSSSASILRGNIVNQQSTDSDSPHSSQDKQDRQEISLSASHQDNACASRHNSSVEFAGLSNTALSLTLPAVTLGAHGKIPDLLQPPTTVSTSPVGQSSANSLYKASKKSMMADIRERFLRSAKPKVEGASRRLSTSTGLIELGFESNSSRLVGNANRSPYTSRSASRLPKRNSFEFDQVGGDMHKRTCGSESHLVTPSDSTSRASFGHPKARVFAEKKSHKSEKSDVNSLNAQVQMMRSQSDSNIFYNEIEKVDEVHGAMHYITANGSLDYGVLLKALYWCSTVQNSPRVCEYLLKCLTTLFELGIFETGSKLHCSGQAGDDMSPHRNKPPRIIKTKSQQKSPLPNELSHTEAATPTVIGFREKQQGFANHPTFFNAPHSPAVSSGRRYRNSTAMVREDSADDGERDVTHFHDTDTRKTATFEFPSHESQPNRVELSVAGNKKVKCTSRFRPGKKGSTIKASVQGMHSRKGCAKPSRKKSTSACVLQNIRQRTGIPNYLRSQPGGALRANAHSALFKNSTPSQEAVRLNYALAVKMIFRIVRSLGCAHGHCGSLMMSRDLSKGSITTARELAHDCLLYLHDRLENAGTNATGSFTDNLFAGIISRLVASMCVADIVEVLHALTSFCMETTSTSTSPGECVSDRPNYGNNFGQSTMGHGTRGAEGIVVFCLLGPFLRRLVRCRTELIGQENMSLFSDIRHLFAYLREVHGSTFRRCMLVAMLCPIHRACERPPPRIPLNWSRMSSRSSTWLASRYQEKSRSGSIFSDVLTEPSRGRRLTSWHTLLPRPSVIGRISAQTSIAASPLRSKLNADCKSDLDIAQQQVEHHWVKTAALKEGLLDFAFLLECCEPGTLPEPSLVSVLLDLEAPVVARACLLMECAFFVHRCGRGEWASWMKFNVPGSYQPPGGASMSRGNFVSPSTAGEVNANYPGAPDTVQLKRNAGHRFYSWAVALGNRINDFVALMKVGDAQGVMGLYSTAAAPVDTVNGMSPDMERREADRKKGYPTLETEENFLDDASVNPSGDACPYALLCVAVQLLLEITTYLREMHQKLPQFNVSPEQSAGKTSDEKRRSKDVGVLHERSTLLGRKMSISSNVGGAPSFKSAKRRLSILMPIFGDAAAHRDDSVLDTEVPGGQTERPPPVLPSRRALSSRRISFAVFNENTGRRGSSGGSVISLDRSPEGGSKRDKHLLGRSLLQRHRESGSLKRSALTEKSSQHCTSSPGSWVSGEATSDHSMSDYDAAVGIEEMTDDGNGDKVVGNNDRTDVTGLESCALTAPDTGHRKQLAGHDGKATGLSTCRSPSRNKMRSQLSGSFACPSPEPTITKSYQPPVRRSISAVAAARRQRASSLLSNDTGSSAFEEPNSDKDVCSSSMPWLDAVINFMNYTSFSCDHVGSCQTSCFDRQQRQCRDLMKAINQVYGSEIEPSFVRSIDRQQATATGDHTSRSEPAVSNQSESTNSGNGEKRQSDVDSLELLNDDSTTSGDEEDASLSEAGRPSEYDARPLNGSSSGRKKSTQRTTTLLSEDSNWPLDTSKCSDPAVETELANWLQRRLGSVASPELQKHTNKPSRFAGKYRKKESRLPGIRRNSSNPLLDKLRIRACHKAGQSGPGGMDMDNPGVSSLLGLSMLASAGAGLWRSNIAASGARSPVYPSCDFVGPEASDDEDVGETAVGGRPSHHRLQKPSGIQELPIQQYLDSQVKCLRSNTFSLLNKSALILTTEQLQNVLPLAWELLLESDEELTSSVACFILFCGVVCGQIVQKMLISDLQNSSPDQRFNAILRFHSLWVHRYHVWSRLDEFALGALRIPPPSIDFVLPSPTLGFPGLEVPDPMWQIRKATTAEEMQLKQNEATKTLVTASTSRRKQQQELLQRTLNSEMIRRQHSRRQFHLTTCPVLDRAGIEPALSREHREEAVSEDGLACATTPSGVAGAPLGSGSGVGLGGIINSLQEEFSAAVRRLSVAPLNRNALNQSRNSSWRLSSIPWFRSGAFGHDDEERSFGGLRSPFLSQPMQQAQYIFPSALCTATVSLIHLLDDAAVNCQGSSINTIAEYVIFQCLLEDTTLFLRYILERLTRTPENDEQIFVLRKMIFRLPELPAQSAHSIFNNLVGYIMFHVRTPTLRSQEAISNALSLLRLVVPHVQNIYFKDLKQTLRREQIDSTLLLTANLPCTKQFNVFDNEIGVAQLVRLLDETKDYQFGDILKDAMDSSGIPRDQSSTYYLCDDRSGTIRNSSHYVRDFYTFKRNHTPKLRLRQYDSKNSPTPFQKNALILKFQEVGKVLFTDTVLRCTSSQQISTHVFFLHEELTKLPSFPRKALESELEHCHGSQASLSNVASSGVTRFTRPLFGIDTIHKLSWCQLLANLFTHMPNTYPWSADLQLFLNVYNGALILHAEDISLLRQCLAFYLQFKIAFSTTGYAGILPSLMRVYNLHQHNSVLTQAVEFACRQFYIMHRTPFVLQLFGSIANYLCVDSDHQQPWSSDGLNQSQASAVLNDSFYQIQPSTLYRLLRLIGRPLPDNLRLLELCNIPQPLKALDFCYVDEEANWSVLEAINLCVTVIVYAPDSYRARQMLTILQSIIPFILRDLPTICIEEACGTDLRKSELIAMQKVSICIRQLISTTEFMARRIDEIRQVNILAPGGPTDRRIESLTGIMSGGWDRQPIPHSTGFNVGIGHGQRTAARRKAHYSTGVGSTRSRITKPTIRSDDVSASVETGATSTSGNVLHPSVICQLIGGRGPREAILQLACDFLVTCSVRLIEIGERHRIPELLDSKSHMRLSEIAQSILKQASIQSDGSYLPSMVVQRYFHDVLPLIDWSHESMRSCKALENLLGRLKRTLPKLVEQAVRKPHIYWDMTIKLVRSVYLTVKKNRSIAHLKEIRILVETLKKTLILDCSTFAYALRRRSHQPSGQRSRMSDLPSSGEHRQRGERSLAPADTQTAYGSVPISPDSSSISASGMGAGKSDNQAKHPTNHTEPELADCVLNATSLNDANRLYWLKFSAEVIRLVALVFQAMGTSLCLKDLCERNSPDYNIRCPTILDSGYSTLAVYLDQIILPLLFRCSSSRKDSPTLSKENVFYALDVCATALFAQETFCSYSTGSRPSARGFHGSVAPSISGYNVDFSITEVSRENTASRSSPSHGPSKPQQQTSGATNLLVPQVVNSPEYVQSQTPMKIVNLSSVGNGTDHDSGLVRLLNPTVTSCLVATRVNTTVSTSVAVQNLTSSNQFHYNLRRHGSVSHREHSKRKELSRPLISGIRSSVLGGVSLSRQSAVTPSSHTRTLDSLMVAAPVSNIRHRTSSGDRFPNWLGPGVAHRLGILGLKLILVAFGRHAVVQTPALIAVLTKLVLNGRGGGGEGIHLWKFFDFLVTYRPPIFIHLLPFIRFKMKNLTCATPGEQAYQQIVNQKLIGLHSSIPETTARLLRCLMTDLTAIRYDIQRNHQRTADNLPETMGHQSKRFHDSLQRLQSQDTHSNQSSFTRKPGSSRSQCSSIAEVRPTLANVSQLPMRHNLNERFTLFDSGRFILTSVTSQSNSENDDEESTSATDQEKTILTVFSNDIHKPSMLPIPLKRISAVGGTRMLQQSRSGQQNDPILTASTESIQQSGTRKTRKRYENRQTVSKSTIRTAGNPGVQSDLRAQCEYHDPIDDLGTVPGPSTAAEVATSLYGSAAPYLVARDKARQEMAIFIGNSGKQNNRKEWSAVDDSRLPGGISMDLCQETKSAKRATQTTYMQTESSKINYV